MANKSGGSGHKRLIFSKLGCFCFVLLIVCGISVLTYTTIPTFFRLFPKSISPAPLCADNQLEFCQINGRQQFSKFIWFIADGTSYQFVDKLEKHFSDHSKVYITHTERDRYSVELYKAWFAGDVNDRMNNKQLDVETIFRSLDRNGIKSSFIGPMYIMNSVMKDSEFAVLQKVEDVEHFKKEKDVLPWPFFFEEGEEGLNKLQEYLYDVSERNTSFVAYSTVSDNIFHKEYTEYKGKYFPVSAQHGDLILEKIGFMKEWIDNHPDTLLIIASDHGYNEMVDHQCITHGTGLKNNTGWQMLYNPQFTPEKSKEMDSLDVVSTVSNYLLMDNNKQQNQMDYNSSNQISNTNGYINIPANNMGIARNLFEQASNNLRAKKQSLAQMINLYQEIMNDWKQRDYWKKKQNQIKDNQRNNEIESLMENEEYIRSNSYNIINSINFINKQKLIDFHQKIGQFNQMVNNIKQFVYNESIYDIRHTIQSNNNQGIESFDNIVNKENEDETKQQIKQILDSISETELKRRAKDEQVNNKEYGIYNQALDHYKFITQLAENAHIQLYEAILSFEVPASKKEVYWSNFTTQWFPVIFVLLIFGQIFFIDLKIISYFSNDKEFNDKKNNNNSIINKLNMKQNRNNQDQQQLNLIDEEEGNNQNLNKFDIFKDGKEEVDGSQSKLISRISHGMFKMSPAKSIILSVIGITLLRFLPFLQMLGFFTTQIDIALNQMKNFNFSIHIIPFNVAALIGLIIGEYYTNEKIKKKQSHLKRDLIENDLEKELRTKNKTKYLQLKEQLNISPNPTFTQAQQQFLQFQSKNESQSILDKIKLFVNLTLISLFAIASILIFIVYRLISRKSNFLDGGNEVFMRYVFYAGFNICIFYYYIIPLADWLRNKYKLMKEGQKGFDNKNQEEEQRQSNNGFMRFMHKLWISVSLLCVALFCENSIEDIFYKLGHGYHILPFIVLGLASIDVISRLIRSNINRNYYNGKKNKNMYKYQQSTKNQSYVPLDQKNNNNISSILDVPPYSSDSVQLQSPNLPSQSELQQQSLSSQQILTVSQISDIIDTNDNEVNKNEQDPDEIEDAKLDEKQTQKRIFYTKLFEIFTLRDSSTNYTLFAPLLIGFSIFNVSQPIHFSVIFVHFMVMRTLILPLVSHYAKQLFKRKQQSYELKKQINEMKDEKTNYSNTSFHSHSFSDALHQLRITDTALSFGCLVVISSIMLFLPQVWMLSIDEDISMTADYTKPWPGTIGYSVNARLGLVGKCIAKAGSLVLIICDGFQFAMIINKARNQYSSNINKINRNSNNSNNNNTKEHSSSSHRLNYRINKIEQKQTRRTKSTSSSRAQKHRHSLSSSLIRFLPSTMVFQYTCLIVIIFFALDSQPRVQIPIPNPQTPVFSNSNTNHFTTSELLNSTTEITNPHKTANFDIQPDEEIAYTPTSLAITMRQNQILLVQVAMLTAFVEIMNLVGSTGFVVISDIAAIGYSLLQKLLRRKSDDYLNF